MSLSQFDGEDVISLETYRKTGEHIRRPVWFLKEDNVLIVHTSDSTGKVRQIRRNPKVRVAPSKFRGEPKTEYIDAYAEIDADQETVDRYYRLIYKKYGLLGSFTKFIQRFSRSRAKDVIIRIRATATHQTQSDLTSTMSHSAPTNIQSNLKRRSLQTAPVTAYT